MRLQKVLSPLLVRIPNYAGAFGSSGFSASSQNWRTQHVAYVRVRWCLCHFMLCAIFGADVLFSSAFFCFATQCICLRFFGSHHRLHLAPYYKHGCGTEEGKYRERDNKAEHKSSATGMLAGAVTGAAGGIFLNKKNCHHRNTTQRITHSWCMVEGGPRRREGRGSNSRREKKHTRKDIKTKPEDGQRYGSFQFCVFSPRLVMLFFALYLSLPSRHRSTGPSASPTVHPEHVPFFSPFIRYRTKRTGTISGRNEMHFMPSLNCKCTHIKRTAASARTGQTYPRREEVPDVIRCRW